MSQNQLLTKAAIEECRAMTTELKSAIAARAAQQKTYDDLAMEYQRRKGIYDSAHQLFLQTCSGSCASGGVQRYGCDPMCTNWRALNLEPTPPTPPVFPSLGQFVCQICSQSVDVSATAGRDIQTAVNQQMECTATLEKQLNSMPGTPVPGPVKPVPIVPISTPAVSSKKTFWLIGGIIVLLIIIGIIAVLIWMPDLVGGEGEANNLAARQRPANL